MTIDHPGARVLYREATPFEKAMADADAIRLMEIPAERVAEVHDPFAISAKNLPFLAWGMGVNLWEDDWSDSTKREWTARQWEFQALRGSLAAVEMVLAANGFALQDHVSAPQGFFASKNLTTEEWNAWIRLMPEVRIYYGSDPGESKGDEWIAGDSFAGEGAAAFDDGPILHGRKAILRHRGVDTPLRMVEITRRETTKTGIQVDRVEVPGLSSQGFFVGDAFADDDQRFVDAEEVAAKSYTVKLDRQFASTETITTLTPVQPGFEPQDIRFTVDSDRGQDNGQFFAGADHVSDGAAGNDDAPLLLADRMFLVDPTVQGAMSEGVSFAGVDRVGFPDFHIELLVDLKSKDDQDSFYVGETFVTEGFAVAEDSRQIDKALRAIVAAKGINDRALVSFETLRPLNFSDTISEAARFGDQVRVRL